jgi:hypothetical protein
MGHQCLRAKLWLVLYFYYMGLVALGLVALGLVIICRLGFGIVRVC